MAANAVKADTTQLETVLGLLSIANGIAQGHWREDYPGSGARCLGPDNDPTKTYEPPCEASLRLFHRFSREHGVLTVRTSTRAAGKKSMTGASKGSRAVGENNASQIQKH